MSGKAAAAEFVEYVLVKTRSVTKLILEIPITETDRVIALLGGTPQPGSTRWVALAPLEDKPERRPGHRSWGSMPPAEQAGVRCGDPLFRQFLSHGISGKFPRLIEHVETAEDAARAVRRICGIESRSELNGNPEAAGRWYRLERAFRAWAKEPVEDAELKS